MDAGNDEALSLMGRVPPCILHTFYYAKLLEGNSVKGTFYIVFCQYKVDDFFFLQKIVLDYDTK